MAVVIAGRSAFAAPRAGFSIAPDRSPKSPRDLDANGQRIAAARATTAQPCGVQWGNGKTPLSERGEACVKQIGAVFYRTEEVAPRAGFEAPTHGLTECLLLWALGRPPW